VSRRDSLHADKKSIHVVCEIYADICAQLLRSAHKRRAFAFAFDVLVELSEARYVLCRS
jgi:hypothetical protein